MFGGLGPSQGAKAAAAPAKFQVYLSNNFVGNEWRVEMQNIARAVAGDKPFANRIDLHIVDAATTPTAQIASLNDIISRRPAAILLDSASPTALNATVAKACRQGILVITYDQIANAPCAYEVGIDEFQAAAGNMRWLALTLHGKGSVAYDFGLPGAPVSIRTDAGYDAVLKQYPGIKVASRYHGDYAPGPVAAALSNVLASNPHISGVICTAGCLGVVTAFQRSHLTLVPFFNYGDASAQIIQDALTIPHMTLRMANNPTTLGGWAVEMAYNILTHAKRIAPPGFVHAGGKRYNLSLLFWQNNHVHVPGSHEVQISTLKNSIKGMPLSGIYPFSLPNAPVTLKQAFG